MRAPGFTLSLPLLAAMCALVPGPASAQDRVRVAINAGQQVANTTISHEQTFTTYFEQGSLTFERTIPNGLFYDGGVAVRVWRGLHAGGSVSMFDESGGAQVTARVPHPLQFGRLRTTSGEVANAKRREMGKHILLGWNFPAAAGLEFMVFGGPSLFSTEQLLVTGLTLTLDKEVFPFDELAFPGAQTETQRDDVLGYNAGVDMTWRFSSHVGVGLLVRYANGKTQFTPSGSQPIDGEVGGLHAGGGLRLVF